jgi:hypothetical protein
MSDHIPDPGKMVSARDVIAASLCMFGAMDTHGRLIETDAILSALAAAGYVIEQDWQPIKTAPKDGTQFIAWWQPCRLLPAGAWGECEWCNGGWCHQFLAEPTHWKPPPVDGPHLAAAKETQA